jgi:hypothetical protein
MSGLLIPIKKLARILDIGDPIKRAVAERIRAVSSLP